ELAPKVQFPIDGKSKRVAPEIPCDASWKLCRVGMARPNIGYRTVALLHLRVELADRHSQLRPRFEYPSSRIDERQILTIRDLDQPVEHRIVKHRPPVAVLLVAGVDRWIIRFEPFLGNRDRGRGKVGTDETPRAAQRYDETEPWARSHGRPGRTPTRPPTSGAAEK